MRKKPSSREKQNRGNGTHGRGKKTLNRQRKEQRWGNTNEHFAPQQAQPFEQPKNQKDRLDHAKVHGKSQPTIVT